ncbi:MAG: carboxypeptidase regulatory-like domain-containing protein [Gemmatimonadaceae bacterium]
MAVRRCLLVASLIATAFPVRSLCAQQADVIRGRITGDDGHGVEDAEVLATSVPNGVNKGAKADKSGRFTITFAGGEGDYWITVRAIGFSPRRFELKRVADEDVLLADAKLARAGVLLDAVRVRADRARAARNDNASDVSGTEKFVGATTADPAQSGNLADMAAALPGVQLIPGADGNPDQFSVFGLGGDQNNTTLNGLAFGGADIPRDAAARASLGTTPWDVSRGGFSGGQFGLRTQSGSNFSSRGASSLLNAPPLEWTDRAGRATGAEFSALSLGMSATGPVALDKSFYSTGFQLDRRMSDLQSIETASPLALQTAGVARDSVARFRDILGRAGVPVVVGALPASRNNDRALFLAAVDIAPPSSTSGQALNITASGTLNRLSSPFGQATALSSSDARRTSWFGSLQARHTDYVGFGVLTETSAGVSRARAFTEPYLALPSGVVRVSSSLDDGSSAISQLVFGGSPVQRTSSTTTTVGGRNQLSWFTTDNTHRIRLTSELRYERVNQDVTMNRLGTWTYNSLADLQARTPASFTRLLSPGVRDGSQLIGGLSLGDSYRPSPDLQIQYGLRLDGNTFMTKPATNAALESTFGVRNDLVPNRLSVSPRAGFSYTYGQAPQLAIASGFTRGPRAVVRGGIGLFQNAPATQLIGSALSNSGLANSVRQLACVGAAVPLPEWSAYLADPGAIPAACADGTTGSVFASSAPNAVLFDRDFAAQRSLRSNLNWSGAMLGDRLASTVDATYSLNSNQAGFADLNFRPETRFSLGDEGGRPVYVSPASIVPANGAIAVQDSRISASFARVTQLRSDLRSVSRQVSVGVRPLAFSSTFSWSLTYVYSNTRDLARGFTSTAGDPRATDWARSPFDSRHQIVYSVAYNFFDWFPVSWSGSFRSGRPFTPLVAGDVNGDGYVNDRAFIFDPRSAADPALASGMRALLGNGSRAARACLAAQLGALAARNSCEAPRTTTSNLTISVNPLKVRLPQRLNVSLYINNAFGAADLLLHGENRRRGWGQSADPDPSLLFVRGFDPAARRFAYDVNPRFGATSLGQTLNRNPVVVTALVRLDIGFTRERQLLTQSLDRGRGRPGDRSSDQDVRSLSGALIPANPMALMLAQADSLKLTRQQADSLSRLNRVYTLFADSVWTPVAKYLAALPAGYDPARAYARFRGAREASVDELLALVPSARSLITAQQMRSLPPFITSSLDTRYLAAVRSSTAGGANLGILGMLAQMGAMGGAVDASGAQTIMVHK